eukprot:COSAG02_NODE_13042_length_1455_cov_1.442478_2_plen_191_part_00
MANTRTRSPTVREDGSTTSATSPITSCPVPPGTLRSPPGGSVYPRQAPAAVVAQQRPQRSDPQIEVTSTRTITVPGLRVHCISAGGPAACRCYRCWHWRRPAATQVSSGHCTVTHGFATSTREPSPSGSCIATVIVGGMVIAVRSSASASRVRHARCTTMHAHQPPRAGRLARAPRSAGRARRHGGGSFD